MARRIIKKGATGRVLKKQSRNLQSHSPDYWTRGVAMRWLAKRVVSGAVAGKRVVKMAPGSIVSWYCRMKNWARKLWGWRGGKLLIGRYWTWRYLSGKVLTSGMGLFLLARKAGQGLVRQGGKAIRRLSAEGFAPSQKRQMLVGALFVIGFVSLLFFRVPGGRGAEDTFTQNDWTSTSPSAPTQTATKTGWEGYTFKDSALDAGTSTNKRPLSIKSTTIDSIDTDTAHFVGTGSDGQGRVTGSALNETMEFNGTIQLKRSGDPEGITTLDSDLSGGDSSLAVDAENGIHVVFSDGTSNSSTLKYVYSLDGGSNWSSQISVPLPSPLPYNLLAPIKAGDFIEIKVGYDQNLYVVFSAEGFDSSSKKYQELFFSRCLADMNKRGKDRYTNCQNGNGWTSVLLDRDSNANKYQYVAISEIEANWGKALYIVYGGKGQLLYIRKCSLDSDCLLATSWSSTYVGTSGASHYSTRLIDNPTDKILYIFYLNSAPSGWGVRYRKCTYDISKLSCQTQSDWTGQSTIDSRSSPTVGPRYVNAVMDSNKKLHVAYYFDSGISKSEVRYAHDIGNSWTTSSIPADGANPSIPVDGAYPGREISIDLVSGNKPYIVGYKKSTNSSDEFLFKYECKTISTRCTEWKELAPIGLSNLSPPGEGLSATAAGDETISGGLSFSLIDDALTAMVQFNYRGDLAIKGLRYMATPFSPDGSFASRVLDSGTSAKWNSLEVELSGPVPPNTALEIRARTQSNTPFVPNTDPNQYCPLGTITSANTGTTFNYTLIDNNNQGICNWVSINRFFEYRIRFYYVNTNVVRAFSPVVTSVKVSYLSFPTSADLISSPYEMKIIGATGPPAIKQVRWQENIQAGTSAKVNLLIRTSDTLPFDDNRDKWYGVGSTDGAPLSSNSSGVTAPCTRSILTGSINEVTCPMTSSPIYSAGRKYVQYKLTLESPMRDGSADAYEINIDYAINTPPDITVSTPDQGSNGLLTIGYSINDNDESQFAVGLFYDVGLRIISDQGGTITVIIKPHENTNDTDLSLQALVYSSGVILIDNEQIAYYKVFGNSFQKNSLSNQPIVRGAYGTVTASHAEGAVVWVRATDSVMAIDFARDSYATGDIGGRVGNGIVTNGVGCASKTTCNRTIRWNPTADIPGKIYMRGKNIAVAANDGQFVRMVGVGGIPQDFTLDTKPPMFNVSDSLSPVTIGGSNVVNTGWRLKSKSRSVDLSIVGQKADPNNSSGSDPNNNDPSANKLLYCLNTYKIVNGQTTRNDRCVSPTIDQIVGGSAPANWTRVNLAFASQVLSNIQLVDVNEIQSLEIIVYDGVGNYSTFNSTLSQREVMLDSVPPPLPPGFTFTTKDASNQTVGALIYLEWTLLDPAQIMDASDTTDFGGFRIWRDNMPASANCGGGSAFCELQPPLSNMAARSDTDSNVNASTTYRYQISVIDNVGNESAVVPTGGTAGIKPNPVGVQPPPPPTISNAQVTASDYSSVTLKWSTGGQISDSLVVYAERGPGECSQYTQPTGAGGVPNFTGFPSQGSSDPATLHMVTLVGLRADTCYFFQVQSRSPGSTEPGVYPKLASDSPLSRKTDTPPPIERPVISFCSGQSEPLEAVNPDRTIPTAHSASFCWITDQPADSFVEYQSATGGTSLLIGQSDATTTHRVSLTGLDKNANYSYRVRSRIPGKGESAHPKVRPEVIEDEPLLPFKTANETTQDTSAPVVSGALLSKCDTTAVVRVTTNEPATHYVEFWTQENPNRRTLPTTPGSLQLSTDVDLNSLQPGTHYFYQPIAFDGSVPPNMGRDLLMREFDTNSTPCYTEKPRFISTPPLKNDPPTATTANIYFSTDQELAKATVYYSLNDTSYNLKQNFSLFKPGPYAVTLYNLEPSTVTDPKQYYYKVVIENPSTLTEESSDCGGGSGSCLFTTALRQGDLPEIRVDTIHVLKDAESSNKIIITWDTGPRGGSLVASNSLVEFGYDAPDGIPTYGRTFGYVNERVSSHRVTLPLDLKEGETYYFKLYSRGDSGEPQVFPVSVSAVSKQCVDPNPAPLDCENPAFTTTDTGMDPMSEPKPPPTITGVGVLLVTNVKVVIGWTTNKAATSEVHLGMGPTYCNEQDPPSWGCPVEDTTLTTMHSVTVPRPADAGVALSANTPYYFSVASEDSKGQRQSKTTPDATDLPLPAGLDCHGTYCFKTTAGTEAVSQEEADALQAEIDRLKGLISDTEGELGDPTLTPEQRATLEKELADLKKLLTELQGRQQGAIKYDTMPPIIADVQVSDITETSAQVRWNTNEQATSIVRFGESEAYSRLAGDTSIFTTSHKVDLKRLDPGTDYHFQVVSYDREGNGAVSGDNTFKTKGIKGEKEEETDEDGEEKKQKGEKDKKGQDEVDEAIKKIQELSKDKKISVEKIIDLLKDFSEEDVSKILSSLGMQLVSPPKFVGGQPKVEVTTSSAAISWQTDKEADSRVAYVSEDNFKPNQDEPYATEAGEAQTFTMDHEVIVIGLESNTVYHYQVRSRERAGRTARSIDRTFKTLPMKPEITSARVAKATENEVTFTWKTNVPTKSTIEYTNLKTKNKRSQGDPQFVTIHQFTLSALESDSRFSAVIRAEDETGLTAASSDLGFTTARDTVAPEISQVRTDVTLLPGKSEYAQAIITWRTNEPASSQVLYEEGITQNANLKNSSPETSEYLLNHVVVLNKLRAATVYRFRVLSADPAGNKVASRDFTLLTPQKKETVLEIIIKNFEDTFGFLKSFGG